MIAGREMRLLFKGAKREVATSLRSEGTLKRLARRDLQGSREKLLKDGSNRTRGVAKGGGKRGHE